jgi:hypothetical protein
MKKFVFIALALITLPSFTIIDPTLLLQKEKNSRNACSNKENKEACTFYCPLCKLTEHGTCHNGMCR